MPNTNPRHTCCWPSCDNPSESFVLPICASHAYQAYEWVKKSEDWREGLTHAKVTRQLAQQREDDAKHAAIQARRLEHGTQQGWIYYLRVGDHIKVGYSADVPQRMRGYPPDSKLLAVHPGTPDLERQIHRDLASSRAWGREWYHPDPVINDRIDQAVAQFGAPAPFTIKVRNTRQPMKPKSWR